MIVAAAAAVTTGMVILQILRYGNASQFERLGDVFLDGMLDFVKLLPGIKKIAGDGIIHQRISVLFEIGNLLIFELASLGLLFV